MTGLFVTIFVCYKTVDRCVHALRVDILNQENFMPFYAAGRECELYDTL